jgi:hypothetical protein
MTEGFRWLSARCLPVDDQMQQWRKKVDSRLDFSAASLFFPAFRIASCKALYRRRLRASAAGPWTDEVVRLFICGRLTPRVVICPTEGLAVVIGGGVPSPGELRSILPAASVSGPHRANQRSSQSFGVLLSCEIKTREPLKNSVMRGQFFGYFSTRFLRQRSSSAVQYSSRIRFLPSFS